MATLTKKMIATQPRPKTATEIAMEELLTQKPLQWWTQQKSRFTPDFISLIFTQSVTFRRFDLVVYFCRYVSMDLLAHALKALIKTRPSRTQTREESRLKTIAIVKLVLNARVNSQRQEIATHIRNKDYKAAAACIDVLPQSEQVYKDRLRYRCGLEAILNNDPTAGLSLALQIQTLISLQIKLEAMAFRAPSELISS
ncbi:MAG: hypothetical protein AB7F28_05545 [Candidatus Margulisiibacteriota bacterium]